MEIQGHPKPGEWVWVEYLDRKQWTEGIFLDRISPQSFKSVFKPLVDSILSFFESDSFLQKLKDAGIDTAEEQAAGLTGVSVKLDSNAYKGLAVRRKHKFGFDPKETTSGERNTNHITNIVLHEGLGRTVKGVFNAINGGRVKEDGGRTRGSTHFIVGRKGEIYPCLDEKYIGWHAGGDTRRHKSRRLTPAAWAGTTKQESQPSEQSPNPRRSGMKNGWVMETSMNIFSIGIDIVLLHSVSSTTGNPIPGLPAVRKKGSGDKKWARDTRYSDYLLLGGEAFWPDAQFNRNPTWVAKGKNSHVEVLMPPKSMLESTWKVVSWLTARFDSLSLRFPGGEIWSGGAKNSGTRLFAWKNVRPEGGTYYSDYNGIMAHQRTSTHGDGRLLEYYCICRAPRGTGEYPVGAGMGPNDAYHATLGAAFWPSVIPDHHQVPGVNNYKWNPKKVPQNTSPHPAAASYGPRLIKYGKEVLAEAKRRRVEEGAADWDKAQIAATGTLEKAVSSVQDILAISKDEAFITKVKSILNNVGGGDQDVVVVEQEDGLEFSAEKSLNTVQACVKAFKEVRELIINNAASIWSDTSREKYYAQNDPSTGVLQTNATIDALIIFSKHSQVCALNDSLPDVSIIKWMPEINWEEATEKSQQLNMGLYVFIITGNIDLKDVSEPKLPAYWK